MSSFVLFFVICQALGAIIGAITAIWGELAYARAMHDGKKELAEFAHLTTIANGLRIGMMILLFSSLGLVIVAFIEGNALQPALMASYWTIMALSLVVIMTSWALARKLVSFDLGSATIFTSWWFLVYLSFGWLPLSFGASVMAFIVVTAIFYALLAYARLLVNQKPHTNHADELVQ